MGWLLNRQQTVRPSPRNQVFCAKPPLLACLLLLALAHAMPTFATDSYRSETLSAASMAPPRAVRIGIHNFPPDFVVSKDGSSCGGTGFEYLRNLLQQAELTLEPVCVTPARMYLLLDQNDIDFSINIKSTKALVDVAHPPVFAEPPYMMLQLVVYSHSRRANAVHDGSIAMIRGFDYQGERQQLSNAGLRPVDLPDAVSAIEMFLKGRTEHLITYDGPFKAYLAAQSMPSVEPVNKLSRKTLQEIPTHVVIGAQSPFRAQLEQLLHSHAQQYRCKMLKNCGNVR